MYSVVGNYAPGFSYYEVPFCRFRRKEQNFSFFVLVPRLMISDERIDKDIRSELEFTGFYCPELGPWVRWWTWFKFVCPNLPEFRLSWLMNIVSGPHGSIKQFHLSKCCQTLEESKIFFFRYEICWCGIKSAMTLWWGGRGGVEYFWAILDPDRWCMDSA